MNLKRLINPTEIIYFRYFFFDIQDLYLFISLRAFLPSLRVLIINQEREEMITMARVIREIIDVSKLLINLQKFYSELEV